MIAGLVWRDGYYIYTLTLATDATIFIDPAFTQKEFFTLNWKDTTLTIAIVYENSTYSGPLDSIT